MAGPALSLSDDDRARVDRVEALARAGEDGLPELLALLVDPSWAVRRTVVSALARAGAAAVPALIGVLLHDRGHEGRLAATVDALVASVDDVDRKLIALAESDVVPAVLCDAVQVLGRRRCRAAVPLLSKLSTHEDDNVAVASTEALSSIGGVETIEPLVRAIDRREFFRTFPAIDALGRTGDPRAVRPLVALLDDPLYAGEAARALGRTGQERAVQPLARLLTRPVDAIVRTAVSALADLRERHQARFGETESIANALPDAVRDPMVSARLAQCLDGAGPSEAAAIARVLGWIGDDAAIASLIELLPDDASPIAGIAADALRALGARATTALLSAIREGDAALRLRALPLIRHAVAGTEEVIACLADLDPDVRVQACEALGRLGHTSSVQALFGLIGDRDARVSQAASTALQSLGSLETQKLALQQGRSEDPRTRRAALRILSYFGYAEALDVLVDAMSDEDERVREAAIYGLPLIDHPRARDALLGAASHPTLRTRAAVMRALGQTSAAEPVVDALLAGLGDGDPWVRYYACQALGRLCVETAARAIEARMSDDAGQVRVAAVEALSRLRAPSAFAALSRAARSDDADMRRAALIGLGLMRHPDGVAILADAAGDSEPATRLVAISALAEFQGPEPDQALAGAASDSDDSVRSAAIGFLSTRPGPAATRALLDQLATMGLRERVIAALAVAPDERIHGILTALESADEAQSHLLVSALGRMHRAGTHAATAAVLLSENIYARRAAAAQLVALGTPEALEPLRRVAATDPDLEIQRLAGAPAKRG